MYSTLLFPNPQTHTLLVVTPQPQSSLNFFRTNLNARLHWRFFLRFQARFRGKLQALEIAAESPEAYTGDLKSP